MKSERLLFEHFQAMVAPARERGLKYSTPRKMKVQSGRSRKGAWIEMALRKELDNDPAVAPARERGLKYYKYSKNGRLMLTSLPQGSVD